jgi:iron complex transport system substrate-binding protein
MIRTVSLLPAATEIVGALGLMDSLVGVSHECDYPPDASEKPRVTHCEIHGAGLPSRQVDRWVTEALASAGTLYSMDEELLRRLRPEIILTQRLCDVCAVGYGSVKAFAATLPGSPQVVNLEPSSLGDIFEDVRRVARALGVPDRGEAVVSSLKRRVDAVEAVSAPVKRRSLCILLEWIDPPYCSGHWNPELVEIAGGTEPLGNKGRDSYRVEWDDVIAARPEVLVLACCGYTVARTIQDLPIIQDYPGWKKLPAVRDQQVYVVDGCAYFSRPGPRVVDSLEMLAEILHPEIFRGHFPTRGAIRLERG